MIEIVQISIQPNTKLIEQVGDDVLLMSTIPESIMITALNMYHTIKNENHFPAFHIGIHWGKIVERDGCYFGSTLNLRSRIASHSKGGQILCSKEFIDRLLPFEGIVNSSIGKVKFKNILIPKEIYEIQPVEEICAKNLDPVCHMQVDNLSCESQVSFDDKYYLFCSDECRKLFLKSPHQYI